MHYVWIANTKVGEVLFKSIGDINKMFSHKQHIIKRYKIRIKSYWIKWLQSFKIIFLIQVYQQYLFK